MKNLHDIIQKNMEKFEREFPTHSAHNDKCNHNGCPPICPVKDFVLSSQLSIIQAIDEWAEKHANEYKGDGLNGRREDIYKMFSDDLRSFLNAKTKLQ